MLVTSFASSSFPGFASLTFSVDSALGRCGMSVMPRDLRISAIRLSPSSDPWLLLRRIKNSGGPLCNGAIAKRYMLAVILRNGTHRQTIALTSAVDQVDARLRERGSSGSGSGATSGCWVSGLRER